MAYLDMEGARNEGVLPKVQRTTAATRLHCATPKLPSAKLRATSGSRGTLVKYVYY
jgi:hypothetical protein